MEDLKREADMLVRVTDMYSTEQMRLLNDYVLLHIKARPWYIPEPLYRWLLGKLVVLSRFKV